MPLRTRFAASLRSTNMSSPSPSGGSIESPLTSIIDNMPASPSAHRPGIKGELTSGRVFRIRGARPRGRADGPPGNAHKVGAPARLRLGNDDRARPAQ